MGEAGRGIGACEKTLSSLLKRRHCILTGNGTSALYIAYSLMNPARPKILLPAMMCLNPLLAVHYAGKIPVFADVLMQDATIDPAIVGDLLEKDKKIGAVLAVHLYGHPADMASLSHICNAHGVMLIEDLAQSLGGTYPDGRLLGTMGKCSVVSFGYSKILDAGGGGAILTDDADLAVRARAMAVQFGGRTSEHQYLAMIYRKLFYSIWECGQADSRFYSLFDMFPSLFKDLHIYGVMEYLTGKIIDLLQNLNDEVSARRNMAELYQTALQGISDIAFFSPAAGCVPWRFTFRVNKERRQSMLDNVRAAGFDISSWYPSIDRWTASGREQTQTSFEVSRLLEKEVVNLWVTRDYNEHRALSLVMAIKKSLL